MFFLVHPLVFLRINNFCKYNNFSWVISQLLSSSFPVPVPLRFIEHELLPKRFVVVTSRLTQNTDYGVTYAKLRAFRRFWSESTSNSVRSWSRSLQLKYNNFPSHSPVPSIFLILNKKQKTKNQIFIFVDVYIPV